MGTLLYTSYVLCSVGSDCNVLCSVESDCNVLCSVESDCNVLYKSSAQHVHCARR